MIRRAMLLVLTALVLVSLSGCMGGGPGIDTTAIKAAIGAVIDDFEGYVEAYNVDGMLGCLSDDFGLTLREGEASYTKDLNTLAGELEADEEDQLAWREDFGYKLDLELQDRVFYKVNAAGAQVTLQFQVVETATGLPRILTDKGEMVWEFVNVGGGWKAKSLLIEFEAVTDKAAGVGSGAAGSIGFGFGVGYEGLAK